MESVHWKKRVISFHSADVQGDLVFDLVLLVQSNSGKVFVQGESILNHPEDFCVDESPLSIL